MVSEPRKQSMARMETDYSKHTHFRLKIKWRLEHLGALGIMGETAHQLSVDTIHCQSFLFHIFNPIEQAADAGQCGTEQRDISVEGLDEEPPLEDNVNFIVHLGTSRVEVETTSRESPSSSETSPANPADTVVVTLPGNQSDRCQDNDSGTSGDYNSVGVERSNACTLAVSHTSVQTPFTHGENEPASSLAESDACAEDTGSYKSVETQWSAEDIPRSSVARCPLGVCVGVRVKKEPMWESTEERSPCLSAEATSASYNAIEDSASSAVVPFPANDPPSASSIERLRECINRIPKVSQISEYAVLPDVHPYNQTQRSSAVNVATAPKTAQPGRVHVISNGQGPSPRPVQVSVGTQHKLCSEAVEFLPGNMRKVDEQNQDCHSILSSGASKRQKTVAASSASPEIHADRDGGKNEPLSEGSGEQSYSGALALTSMDVSVATSSQEAPTSQATSPQTSVASGQSLLPMIVSVMSYGIPETSTPSTAHAQGNRVPSPTGQVTSAKRLKVRERSVSNESLLRSEIQFLRDELLEERRLRRAVEMQLSKCMLQLNRQKTVSQQLAEALKPFIFKS